MDGGFTLILLGCLAKVHGFDRGSKSYQAFSILWKNGFPEDAVIIARSMFEIMLQCEYIRQYPKQCEKLFGDFEPYSLYRAYTRICNTHPKTAEKLVQRSGYTLVHLQTHYKRVKKQFRNRDSWYGSSISVLANKVGFESTYKIVYSLFSDHAHSHFLNLFPYLKIDKHGVQLFTAPQLEDDNLYLIGCVRILLSTCESVNGTLKMNLQHAIRSAWDEFIPMEKQYGIDRWGTTKGYETDN